MERTPRRFWTWAVTGGAVLVILAAAASGLFQVAVQLVPGYRADVERYVREVTGQPIRIDALALTWHYSYPSLDLVGVALLGEDGATAVLKAERLRLGFGLLRLLRGDTAPDRLELHGLALDARIDRDGRVRVRGVEAAGGALDDPAEALRPLTRFGALRVERCRLNLRDDRRGSETWSFGIAYAELSRGLLGEHVEAEVALPASIGDSARFEGAFTGELLEPATWSGEGTLDLSGIAAGTWLEPYLERGARVETAGVQARLTTRIESGRLDAVESQLRAGATRLARADHVAGFEALEARAGIQFRADGWTAELRQLTLETAAGRWSGARGELRATAGAGASPLYEGRLSHLRLADVAPWLRLLRVPVELAQFDQAAGDLLEAQFRFQAAEGGARYSYRARFEDLALPAGGRAAGFAGAHGELAGDERGGRAVLQDRPLNLELPGVLVSPVVPFDSFEAELEWSRRDDGWRVGMPAFRWAMLGTRGRGRFEVLLPDARGRSPELDLAADFVSDDATRAKALMPLHWSAPLRTWLDRSIVAGRATRAALVIQGPLADFPFQQRATGKWTLDIEAQGAELAYHPDWPPVEDIAATLRFSGNSLDITASRGKVAGNPLTVATARFPDLQTGQLLVDGKVSGETARYYDFLSRSPLRRTFAALLAQTTASGPATVEIHLDIPVDDALKTRTSGKVALDGVELRHASLPEPIRNIRGSIAFSDDGGIRAERLTARLYELALQATLTPRSPTVTQLAADFRFAPDPQGRGASELVPAFLRGRLAGESAWRAELPIGAEGEPPVTLRTDLAGVEVKLPPPLGKPAAEAVPLVLTVGSQGPTPLRITLDYQERFGADLHFARPRGRDALELQRGALRAGGGPPIAASEKGLTLGGQLPELDLQAWVGALRGAGLDRQIGTLRRADLRVGRARWDRVAVRDARYQWAAEKDGWSLSTIGAGAIGDLRWHGADRGSLTARMDQLAFDLLPPPAEEDAAGSPIDPGELPLFDLDVRRVAINQAELGHVVLATARTDAGQKLKTLSIDGATRMTAAGEWRRRAGQSSATLDAELVTADIAALLRAFHYTPNLDAKVARFRSALTWMPARDGIEWQQAQGTIHLEFENGQLRAVEPGAGRVLGLVNFYALPRRLTLNFRDVLSSGLGFDKINGDFELRDGDARTQNLDIAGPSLRMEVRGRIGLAARDYDQLVTVYPDVSAGVTLGAVLLGGPVAGVLALIAQEVLDKPLNQVTQLSYRVTGGWDNPQVESAPTEVRDRLPGVPPRK